MRFLHPISFVRPGIKELPSDLALEARDCATLYHAMSVHSKDPEVAKLRPIRFFKRLAENGTFLQQKDIIRYEEELKRVLTKWLKEEDAHEETSTIRKVVKELTDKEVGLPEPERALEKRELFFGNLVNLLSDLHANGDLVSIIATSAIHLSHLVSSPPSCSTLIDIMSRRLAKPFSNVSRRTKLNGESTVPNGPRRSRAGKTGRLVQKSEKKQRNGQH